MQHPVNNGPETTNAVSLLSSRRHRLIGTLPMLADANRARAGLVLIRAPLPLVRILVVVQGQPKQAQNFVVAAGVNRRALVHRRTKKTDKRSLVVAKLELGNIEGEGLVELNPTESGVTDDALLDAQTLADVNDLACRDEEVDRADASPSAREIDFTTVREERLHAALSSIASISFPTLQPVTRAMSGRRDRAGFAPKFSQ